MNETTKNYEGLIDFEVTYVSEGDAIGRMPVQAGILNPFGTVHAGAMIWFADVVATTLALQGVAPVEGMTGFPVAINLSANLLSNCREGELIATARFVKKGRRVSTVRTIVESGQGKLLLDVTTSHVAS
ncbi:PaaI family thioesterase [Marinobacter orientalis]|uniref:PaaI family thioesterase n=1 Tax=Marinobacter orientalis TaxID=1928859 RepID=A0A7Y0RC42_9GAMM|nr:PaaI family thioesterase [Marinobacter orientalis]NMT63497.1 PaaI family thioesterase [Marinobacter orientalis]TGX48557.1 PaaI family thioesterase [Marinobacter orientalis]